ncbi:MAG: hypothetical protein HYU54_06340 [Actinobacteria bacterium]|nr:hypothetical protein [Actinomycetota bacterium]
MTTEQVFSISIETAGSHPEIERLEDFHESLASLGARGLSVGSGGLTGGPSATFVVALMGSAVEIPQLFVEATARAVDLFVRAAEKAGLSFEAITRVDAMSEDYLERDLEQEPESYVGVSEIAALLGVSRQRVAELRGRAGFPSPVAELAAGPVWTRSSLNRFVDSWERKPGRPRREPPSVQSA